MGKIVIRTLSFLIALISYLQCSTRAVESENTRALLPEYNVSLKPDSKVVLPIDKRTPNLSNHLFLIRLKDGREFLTLFNATTSELSFFDLATKSLHKKILIQQDGPNGVGLVTGIYPHTLDSIYVGSMKKSIFLVNSEGNIIQQIDFWNSEMDEYGYDAPFPLAASHVFTPFIFHDSKIYLFSMAQGSLDQLKASNKISTQRVCFEIDTIENTGKYLPFTFPKEYWSKGVVEPTISRILVNDQFVYSFFGDHNIYVTKDHITFKKHLAKSDLFHDFVYYENLTPTIEEYNRQFVETPGYWSIQYDSYRNVYYRIVKLGIQDVTNDDYQKFSKFPPNFSIMVLDSAFNKITELEFNNSKDFVFTNSFISKEGLCISNNHPESPLANEDSLVFTIFKIVHKDEAK